MAVEVVARRGGDSTTGAGGFLISLRAEQRDMETDREGGREGEREREGGRERGREGGREGEKERERGREGEREREREGGREEVRQFVRTVREIRPTPPPPPPCTVPMSGEHRVGRVWLREYTSIILWQLWSWGHLRNLVLAPVQLERTGD